MTATTSTVARLRENPWTVRAALLLTLLAFLGALTLRAGALPADARKAYRVPEDAKMESSLGIRVTQASVVGHGGLVEIRYTVLDTQKASKFQNDVHHPPVLYSQRNRSEAVYRTALMKQGHNLRPGQTYFILYENNGGVVHRGDDLEIDAGGSRLINVPVR